MNIKVFTVSQINGYIKSLMEDDILLNGFFIEAEISNFKNHSSGHFYFTLKDERATVNCIMFRSHTLSLKFLPENGMKVIAYGSVSVYEKTGQYQIYVELLEPSGKGALYTAYEQLKQKLEAEGLFALAHKKEIQPFPSCIAVVTSKTGAVIRDIIHVTKRRNPNVKIVLVPVAVQGEDAPREIIRAINMINEWGKADVMIVGRGGGSIEELWAFNDEGVARAVFDSRIPVISAVGHETDYTIIDFVADLRAPTPSAAAELAVSDMVETKEKLYVHIKRVQHLLDTKLAKATTKLSHNMNRAPIRKPLEAVYAHKATLLAKQHILYHNLSNQIQKNRMIVANKIDSLEKVSPLNILKRGYSLVYNKNNQLVTSKDDVHANESITIMLKTGTIDAVVTTR